MGGAAAVRRLLALGFRWREDFAPSLAALYVGAAVALIALHRGPGPVNDGLEVLHGRILGVVGLVGLFLAPVLALVGLVRVRLLAMPIDVPAPKVRLLELRALRRALTTALTILAGVISLAVISTAQLRLTRIAHGANQASLPTTLVVVYGAIFAGVLGLIYAPVFGLWQERAEATREALCAIPESGLPDEAWGELRARLTALLELDASWSGAVFTVLSPLVVGLLGYFLPKAGS